MTEDEVAMQKFQQGSVEAYEEIVRRWESPMLHFFHRSVGDMDTAEDLRQDLFVRLYMHRHTYRGNGVFRAWLYSIATNLLRTHFRTRKMVSIDDPNGDGEPHPEPPDGGEPVQEKTHRKHVAGLVRRFLASLPSDDREALILRFFQHLQYNEIAEALGIPEPTAKSRVYRAIERLREMMVAQGLTAGELL